MPELGPRMQREGEEDSRNERRQTCLVWQLVRSSQTSPRIIGSSLYHAYCPLSSLEPGFLGLYSVCFSLLYESVSVDASAQGPGVMRLPPGLSAPRKGQDTSL